MEIRLWGFYSYGVAFIGLCSESGFIGLVQGWGFRALGLRRRVSPEVKWVRRDWRRGAGGACEPYKGSYECGGMQGSFCNCLAKGLVHCPIWRSGMHRLIRRAPTTLR